MASHNYYYIISIYIFILFILFLIKSFKQKLIRFAVTTTSLNTTTTKLLTHSLRGVITTMKQNKKILTMKEYEQASHYERMSFINKLCEAASKKRFKDRYSNFYEV